jgi:phage/plasmid-associated DNA primase
MRYQGVGDAAIHKTQLQVSASLVRQGVPQQEIIDLLLHATRIAAGEYGLRWNWVKEERNIEKMCVSALEKFGTIQRDELKEEEIAEEIKPRAKRQAKANQGEEQSDNVVDLDAARQALGAKVKNVAQQGKSKKFKRISECLKEAIGDDLMFIQDLPWRYHDGLWIAVDNFNSWINVEIQNCCNDMNELCTINVRNEVREDIKADRRFRRECDPPWNQHGKVPTLSGLVEPSDLTVTPPAREHYCSWRVPCKFNWQAQSPLWTRMLKDCFPEPEEKDNIKSIQELLGAGLIDNRPRALRRAMVLHGGTNCGKSSLLNVFEALFGGAISIDIEELEKHGLTPFRQRLPWILHEAFDQSTWHTSSVVKSLITGETVTANIKNGPFVSVRYNGPALWGSNHSPKFKENTEAIISRILPIACNAGFDDETLIGVAKWARAEGFAGPGQMVAARELEGVLAWAVEGLRRAQMRGAITISADSLEEKKAIWREANIVEAFVEECCEIDRNWEVTHCDFCLAVTSWHVFNYGDGTRKLPNNKQIGIAIRSLHNKRIGDRRTNKIRFVVGLKLNEEGKKHFEHGRTAVTFQGKALGASTGDPNHFRPVKPEVVGDEKGDKSGDNGGDKNFYDDIKDTF